ncbi:MAG: hypothetical protein AAB632_01440 [Patescibacteria group bacterium]
MFTKQEKSVIIYSIVFKQQEHLALLLTCVHPKNWGGEMLSFRKRRQEGRIGIMPMLRVTHNVLWGVIERKWLNVPVVEVGKVGRLSRVEVVKGSEFDKRAFRKKVNGSLQPTDKINWDPISLNI